MWDSQEDLCHHTTNIELLHHQRIRTILRVDHKTLRNAIQGGRVTPCALAARFGTRLQLRLTHGGVARQHESMTQDTASA